MKKVSAAVFCAVLLAFVVSVTVFPRDMRTIENENRSFNRLPELSVKSVFTGSFAEGIEPWISDRVVRRADFISVALAVSNGYGVPAPVPSTPAPTPTPILTPVPTPVVPDSASTAIPPTPTNAAPTPATPQPTPFGRPRPKPRPERELQPSTDPEDSAQLGAGRVKGPMLVFDDRLVELFGYSKRAAERYAEVINEYREALPENVRVFSILVPTQIEFMPEPYSETSDSALDAINTVYEALAEGVTPVDAYSEIEAHRDEYIYFRTDHHWTALGAYYAYRAFSTAAGFEPKALSEYEETAIPGFLGYLYNMSPSQSIKEKPDTIFCYSYKGELETSPRLLYPPSGNGKALYSVFIGGDHPILRISTSVKNGKTAVVIKDSFANAFVPWLAPHYENIIVLDARHFDGSAVAV
ncbi:MAG: hypothetical protein LBH17_02205, partial [Oscillospiraceae bacterium]|nr:hypothetical protein [Oscillospiraceae bacterium]